MTISEQQHLLGVLTCLCPSNTGRCHMGQSQDPQRMVLRDPGIPALRIPRTSPRAGRFCSTWEEGMEDGGLRVLMLPPLHDMAQVPPEIFLGSRLVLPSRVAACKHSVTLFCFQESPPSVTQPNSHPSGQVSPHDSFLFRHRFHLLSSE